jgi:hypothetical protein
LLAVPDERAGGPSGRAAEDDGPAGISAEVWNFEVSGYRLLFRWLDARKGLPVDHAMITGMRDVVGRIAELIDLFAQADQVLERALPATLSREALGPTESEAPVVEEQSAI